MPSVALAIQAAGPVLQAFVGVSVPRAEALRIAGLPIPQMQMGMFLVDTGASHSVVDRLLISPLGITPTGVIPIHTPSTGAVPQHCNQFDVAIAIPGPIGTGAYFLEAISITEADFSKQAIQGLIGRDILAKCHMTYMGPANQFFLSW